MAEKEYDDGLIALSDDALVIRRYDLFLRPRSVPYLQIHSVTPVELRGFRFGNWRLWGSSDLIHWFHADWHRPKKHVGLVLDVAKGMKPVITPDDPQRVATALRSHGIGVTEPEPVVADAVG